MELTSIGDEVKPGRYRLHSRFRRAVNFTDGRRLVTLVTPEVGAGPLNIVVRDLPRQGSALRVGRYSVSNAHHRWAFTSEQTYRSPLSYSLKEARPAFFRKNLRVMERILAGEAHPKSLAFLLDPQRTTGFSTTLEQSFVRRVQEGVAKMFRGMARGIRSDDPGSPPRAVAATVVAGVRLLSGCGFGLTPSGDDFIAGHLIGLNLLQASGLRDCRARIGWVYHAARSSNLLTRTFLRLAREGRVTGKQKDLVETLLDGDEERVGSRVRDLLGTGATSGADLATGFVVTVQRGISR